MWREHTKEVYSVDWSNINKTTFCSGSWDGFVRLVRSAALALSLVSEIPARSGLQTGRIRSKQYRLIKHAYTKLCFLPMNPTSSHHVRPMELSAYSISAPLLTYRIQWLPHSRFRLTQQRY